jgi:hypothetical protein
MELAFASQLWDGTYVWVMLSLLGAAIVLVWALWSD